MGKRSKRRRQTGQRKSAAGATRRKSRRRLYGAGILLIVVLGVMAFWLLLPEEDAIANITVYKSATCDCCKKWISHLERHNFDVSVVNRNDVVSKKQELGVPTRLYSCHTARVDGYVVEGHVPAQDIMRLLEQKPDIRGIGLAGMPIGSPGMEQGSRKDPYTVYAFDAGRNTSVFARH